MVRYIAYMGTIIVACIITVTKISWLLYFEVHLILCVFCE